MEPLKIEILNPKALQFIIGLQDLDLIKIIEEPEYTDADIKEPNPGYTV